MIHETLKKSYILGASKTVVWEYLTDKDKLGLWLHQAKANFELGKPFTLLGKADEVQEKPEICWGEVLEMDAPNLLKFTFTIKPLNGVITTVTWALQEVAGGTKLTLTHEGIGATTNDAALGILTALDGGWDGHLVRLRAALKK